jgi:hypothetical protein
MTFGLDPSIPVIQATDTIAAGTNVICAWGTAAALPDEATLRQIVDPFGEPFTLAYLPEGVQYVGVRISNSTPAVELMVALTRDTGGHVPLLLAAPSSLGGTVELEIGGEKVVDAFDSAREAITESIADTTSGAAWGLKNFPLVVGLALVGVVLLAAGALYYQHKAKKG